MNQTRYVPNGTDVPATIAHRNRIYDLVKATLTGTLRVKAVYRERRP